MMQNPKLSIRKLFFCGVTEHHFCLMLREVCSMLKVLVFLEGSVKDKALTCHSLLAWSKPSKSTPDAEMTA